MAVTVTLDPALQQEDPNPHTHAHLTRALDLLTVDPILLPDNSLDLDLILERDRPRDHREEHTHPLHMHKATLRLCALDPLLLADPRAPVVAAVDTLLRPTTANIIASLPPRHRLQGRRLEEATEVRMERHLPRSTRLHHHNIRLPRSITAIATTITQV